MSSNFAFSSFIEDCTRRSQAAAMSSGDTSAAAASSSSSMDLDVDGSNSEADAESVVSPSHEQLVAEAEVFGHQATQSSSSQLNPAFSNYGMPLDASTPVHSISRRQLLPLRLSESEDRGAASTGVPISTSAVPAEVTVDSDDPDKQNFDLHMAAQEEIEPSRSPIPAHDHRINQADPRLSNYCMPLSDRFPVFRLHQPFLLPRPDSPHWLSACRRLFFHCTVGIKSPMGTGKSEAYFCYLAWLLLQYPELRVLIIDARVTLTSSLQQRAEQLNLQFVRYNQEECKQQKGYLQQQSRVIIQLDSLPKLIPLQPGPSALHFDLVLIDESESTLHHFGAESLKNNADVWRCFQLLCRGCTQLLMLDADLGARSHALLTDFHTRDGILPPSASADSQRFADFISSPESDRAASESAAHPSSSTDPNQDDTDANDSARMERDSEFSAESLITPSRTHSESTSSRSPQHEVSLPGPDDILVVVNSIQTDNRLYMKITSEAQFYRRLRHLLDRDQRIVIPINRKDAADKIYGFIVKEYPLKKDLVKYYHGDISQHEKESASECNTLWVQFDVVIYTPTIVYGVDFNPDYAHFDTILAYGVASSNTVREFTQMLGRVRKIKSDTVYIYIDCVPDMTGNAPTVLGSLGYSPYSSLLYSATGATSSTSSLRLPSTDALIEEIKNDIDRDWFTLNRTGGLLPMLREDIREGGQLRVRYHDPTYRTLFILNLRERRLSAAHFSEMFWRAVRERGGTVVQDDMPVPAYQHQGKIPSFDEIIVQLDADQAFQLNCKQIAAAVETDPILALQRQKRIFNQTVEERDRPFIKNRQLRDMYHLVEVKDGSSLSPDQLDAMSQLVQFHGQSDNLSQFQHFCLVNNTLPFVAMRWIHCTMDSHHVPVRLEQKLEEDMVRLIKGLLAMVGFVRHDGMIGQGDGEEVDTATAAATEDISRSAAAAATTSSSSSAATTTSSQQQPTTAATAAASSSVIPTITAHISSSRKRNYADLTNARSPSPAIYDPFVTPTFHQAKQVAAITMASDHQHEPVIVSAANRVDVTSSAAAAAAASSSSSSSSLSTPLLEQLTDLIDTADICSTHSVNSSSVRSRLSSRTHRPNNGVVPDWHEWLRQQEAVLQSFKIRFQHKAVYSVSYVMQLLNRTLVRLLGFGVIGVKAKKRAARGTAHPHTHRPNITYWTIETERRDSMLELAYSASRSRDPKTHQRLGEWIVATSMATAHPRFRWQLLTGIENDDADRQSRPDGRIELESDSEAEEPKGMTDSHQRKQQANSKRQRLQRMFG